MLPRCGIVRVRTGRHCLAPDYSPAAGWASAETYCKGIEQHECCCVALSTDSAPMELVTEWLKISVRTALIRLLNGFGVW